MKILITGLCLQGNKGGPAIFLSLRAQLKKIFGNDISIILAVPGNNSWKHELEESKRYDVEIIEMVNFEKFYIWNMIQSDLKIFRKLKCLIYKIRECDLIIDMSGVAYVGFPVRKKILACFPNRFLIFFLCLIQKKQFISWTQNYGPLNPWILKLMLWIDLSFQKIIFCRGAFEAEKMKKIFKNKKVLNFPDVAFKLDYNIEDGYSLLQKNNYYTDNRVLVGITPSIMIYNKFGEKYLEYLKKIIKYLAKKYNVIIIPHFYRRFDVGFSKCDYRLSLKIYDDFKKYSNVLMIDEDHSAVDLKSIISNTDVYIGARYHGLIAALSSGVPSMSFSWHDKYLDIMSIFFKGHESKFIIDLNKDLKDFYKNFEWIVTKHSFLKKRIKSKNKIIDKKIDLNFKILKKIYEENH